MFTSMLEEGAKRYLMPRSLDIVTPSSIAHSKSVVHLRFKQHFIFNLY